MGKDLVKWNLCKNCEHNCIKYVGYNFLSKELGKVVYVKEKSGFDDKCKKMVGNSRGKGRKVSEEHKAKLIQANKDRIWTDEMRSRVSKSVSEYYKDKPNPMEGKKHTLETRRKIIQANLDRITCKGKKHYLFKGSKANNPSGLSGYRKKKAYLKEYLFENDGCECCGKIPKYYVVHHLIEVKKVIDILQDINHKWNLMALCPSCHTKIHNWLRGMKVSLDKEQKLKYIKRYKIAKEKMKEKILEVRNG